MSAEIPGINLVLYTRGLFVKNRSRLFWWKVGCSSNVQMFPLFEAYTFINVCAVRCVHVETDQLLVKEREKGMHVKDCKKEIIRIVGSELGSNDLVHRPSS